MNTSIDDPSIQFRSSPQPSKNYLSSTCSNKKFIQISSQCKSEWCYQYCPIMSSYQTICN